jgi:TRAP-type C4-dicarboxylate transport system substrate-binding protein
MKVSSLAVAGLFSLSVFSAVQAQTKWDMPTPYSDGTFHTVVIRQFVSEVKLASGSALDVTVHSNASLIKHPDILRAVQTGQVPIGEILLSQFANEDPMFEADNLPFLASGWDNAAKLYKVHKKYVEERMMKRGIRVLYSVPWAGQGLYTKKAVGSGSDLVGLKFRAYNPSTAKLAELLKMTPTTVQAADVPQAFATNLVDSMVSSSATGVATKAWEYAKHFYDVNAWHPRNAVIVNERAFQSLPEASKNALLKASADAEKRGWETVQKDHEAGLKNFREKGISVDIPSESLTKAFAGAGNTMVRDWVKKAGSDGEALIKAYLN